MPEYEASLPRKRKSESSNPKETPKKRAHKPILFYSPNINIFSDYKIGAEIRVYIDQQYLFSNNSKKVWGNDYYSDDSDLVGVCQHMGWINIDELMRTRQSLRGIVATVKIVEPRNKDKSDQSVFNSSFRNKIRSRSVLKSVDVKNAFTVIKCHVLRNYLYGEYIYDEPIFTKLSREQLEHQRFLPDVTLVYNLSNEPVFKYSLKAVSDEGFTPNQFASFKLLSKVLYLETRSERYELSLNENNLKYKFVKVNLESKTIDKSKTERPLSNDKVTIVFNDLDWKDISWGDDTVLINGETFKFTNAQWIERSKPIIINSENENPTS